MIVGKIIWLEWIIFIYNVLCKYLIVILLVVFLFEGEK